MEGEQKDGYYREGRERNVHGTIGPGKTFRPEDQRGDRTKCVANLPAGLLRKTSDLHSECGTAGMRMALRWRVLGLTRSASKLHGQTVAVKDRSIFHRISVP